MQLPEHVLADHGKFNAGALFSAGDVMAPELAELSRSFK